jgi:putative FmdB family regulatory protein
MPTYAYQCKECKFEFEEFHSMTEKIDSCIKCGQPVIKLISAGFIKKRGIPPNKQKPGEVVKKYIEDVRQEVNEEKGRLKTQEYPES